MQNIHVLEMFNSISGEVSPFFQGCPTTFIRLSRCNLNCSYCDTPTAHDDGESWDKNKLLVALTELYQKTGRLCITGGEPLLQMEAVTFLCSHFECLWIETNGTIDFSKFIGSVGIVADFKLEFSKNIPPYFYKLTHSDFIKFVIGNEQNFDDAINIQRLLQIAGCPAMFAFSPIHGEYSAKKILEQLNYFMLPNTIINIQIHKYLDMK